MQAKQKFRLGDMLVKDGIISDDQLMAALAEQKRSGRKLGHTLIHLGFLEEEILLEFLSRQFQIPNIDLRHYKLDHQDAQVLPETIARRFRVLVLAKTDHDFLIGMSDPTDLMALDEIGQVLKKHVRAAVVRESDLLSTIDQVYRRTEEITNLAGKLDEELSETEFDLGQLLETDDVSEAPVVKLLQSVFEDAVQVNASDIHIEPEANLLRIRQRIDGVLQEHVVNEARIASALVIRLKLMSGLNISEKRVPQDGRFNMRVNGKPIDVRLSTLPVQHGESVVMRLLDKSASILDLEQIGMPQDLLERLRKHIHSPHGLVLVTGPTGSGKTTTLYAALSELNTPEKKIITAEDPVEYTLPRINQVQIKPSIGLTFASVLRSALRQDPDVVLVGEMRDQETSEIALRAAMTGHLVMSTLHTNGAIATASRLIDMGAQGYLVASALRAIIAQRLVRRNCEACVEEIGLDTRQDTWLEAQIGDLHNSFVFRQGRGCSYCNNTGYRGRIGVYELLELTEDTFSALRDNDSGAFTLAAKASPGFKPFTQCALEYARAGTTSLEEVIRISGEGM